MTGDAPTSLIELINALIDPIEPAPVSMVPQTWGWAVIAGALLLALVAGVWRLWRHYRANAYRRAALQELGVSRDDPRAIADILRRTALAAYPRTQVASLSGDDWLQFLDQTSSGTTFTQGPGRIIATAPYTGATTSEKLTELAAHWIKRHRPEEVR
ncbi:DUF4381 domain-containing protein [Pseudoruegeria sp. SK021]|uniref:DUF4381 domain-containing protein n=1 Tax=Pseudoruegeria sp. SK021 TaxID=1933035 RepID=UPI000A22433E|nr:DUF4381 domain-containing protein [Pseudoruegeria sp. SK021]OSP53966.1 hypothetical protein BV911_14975 [Pseudoruegeria sp. SK021]